MCVYIYIYMYMYMYMYMYIYEICLPGTLAFLTAPHTHKSIDP